MFKIAMGTRVRDKVTQFTGIVTARAEYDNGQLRSFVSGSDSTGRPCETWVDEERCEVVEA